MPIAISTALVRPSPSASPLGSRTFKVFAEVCIGLEFPAELVAINVNAPDTPGAIVMLSVAELPSEAMVAELTVIGGGTKAGTKENVAAVRVEPVTCRFGIVIEFALLTVDLGEMERMAGIGMKVKLLDDVAVWPPVVTEIGPDVALAGTVTTIVVEVADRIVPGTPLKLTVFEATVEPKFCP